MRTVCWAPVVQTGGVVSTADTAPALGSLLPARAAHTHTHPTQAPGTLSRDEPCVWWLSPLAVHPRGLPQMRYQRFPEAKADSLLWAILAAFLVESLGDGSSHGCTL